MGTLYQDDAGFEDVPHLQLGDRLCTVAHSAKEAKAMIWVGAIITAACGGMFASMNETLLVVGVMAIWIGPIAIGWGIVQLRRADKITHVYRGGIVQRSKDQDTLIAFDQVTDAELTFTEMRGTLHMKFVLYGKEAVIQFTDTSSLAGAGNQGRMRGLVQYIVDNLPPSVTVEGTHAVQRSPGVSAADMDLDTEETTA